MSVAIQSIKHSTEFVRPMFFKKHRKLTHAMKNIMKVFVFYLVCTLYYQSEEQWSVINSIYFLTMSITTVGFGDFHPTSDRSRVATIFVILVGLVFIFSIINEFATSVMEAAAHKAEKLAKNREVEPGSNLKGWHNQMRTLSHW